MQVHYLWTEGHIQGVGVILHAFRWPANSDLSRNDGATTLEHWDLRQREAQMKQIIHSTFIIIQK